MKKFTFLCALLFSFCGILSAQQVTSASDLSNSKVYTLLSSRGYWMSDSDGLANGGSSIVDSIATQYQFGLYHAADGNYYLYSVTAKSFVVPSSGAGVYENSLSAPVTLISNADNSSVTSGCFVIKLGSSYMNFGGSKEVAINSWGTPDAGNILTITAVADIEESVMTAVYEAALLPAAQSELTSLLETAQICVDYNGSYSGTTALQTAMSENAAADGDDLTAVQTKVANMKAAIATFNAGAPAKVLTSEDGLPGTVSNSKYSWSSETLNFGADVDIVRFTVLTSSSGTAGNSGYPCFALAEMSVADAEGNAVTLTSDNFTTNAQESSEGPIANICDGSTSTYFHSTWSSAIFEYPYVQIALPQSLSELTLSYVSRNTATLPTLVVVYGTSAKQVALDNLKAAIDNLNAYEIGTGYGQYTNTSDVDIAAKVYAAQLAYESGAELSIAEVDSITAILNAIDLSALTINVPADGSFLRIRSTASSQSTQPYLTGVNSDAGNGRAAFSVEKDASSIFYYKDSTLVSYTSGLYLANSGNFPGYAGMSAEPMKFSFQASANGEAGAYNVAFIGNNSATRYLYTNANLYTDGGGSASLAGYNFEIEAVDALPVTVGETGYTTLYAPVALTIPDEIAVRAATAADSTSALTLAEVTGTIPAESPVILSAEAGTYDFAITTSEATASESVLSGTVATIAGEGAYTLQVNDSLRGFYACADSVAPFSAYGAASYTFAAFEPVVADPVLAGTFAYADVTQYYGNYPLVYEGDSVSVNMTLTNTGGKFNGTIRIYAYNYTGGGYLSTYVDVPVTVKAGETKTMKVKVSTANYPTNAYVCYYFYAYPKGLSRVYVGNVNYMYVTEAPKSEAEQAAEALEEALDAAKSIQSMNIGTGLNEYVMTGATAEELAAAVEAAQAAYDSITDATTAETIAAATAALTAVTDSINVSLNMPADGTFLRIRSTASSQAAQPYLTGVNSTITGKAQNRAAFTTEKDASSIFYYKDGTLLNYASGLYLTNCNNFAAYGGMSAEPSAISFAACGNGEVNAYNVIFTGNSGATRYLYTNASDSLYFSDAGGGYSAAGYNFVLEAVDSLPVTIGESGYATLYAPVALVIPDEVGARTATAIDSTNALTLSAVAGTLPAETPVILASDAGTYDFAITTSSDTTASASVLTGTLAAVAGEGAYTLQVDSVGPGFAACPDSVAPFSAYADSIYTFESFEPLGPASLSCSAATIGASAVYEGDDVSVTMTITNTGREFDGYIRFYVYYYNGSSYVYSGKYNDCYVKIGADQTSDVTLTFSTEGYPTGNYAYFNIYYGTASSSRSYLAQASFLYVYEAQKTEAEEAAEALEEALTTAKSKQQMNVGTGLNEYTATGATAEQLAAAIAAAQTVYDSINDATTVETITAATAALTAVSDSMQMTLNMPEPGTFLRIRAAASSRAAQPYMTSDLIHITNAAGTSPRALFSTVKDASSIFYYEAQDSVNKLLAYTTGYYLDCILNMACFNGITDGMPVSFSECYNGEVNAYNVIFNGMLNGAQTTRYLYTQMSTDSVYYSDAGGSGSAAGYNFVLEEVEALPVTVGESGYTTLYAPVALSVPEGVTAYTAAINGEALTMTAVEGVIPAATAVIVVGEEGEYEFAITASDATATSALVGAYKAQEAASITGLYTLQTQDDEPAFYPQTSGETAPFSAYIVSSNGAAKIALDSAVTGIEKVAADSEANPGVIYDLSGRAVKNPAKGIYVVNGKAVYLK